MSSKKRKDRYNKMKNDTITSSSDNLKLHLTYIEPSSTKKGIVQISHGMAEHKERYYEFMEYLSKKGYIAVIHDHRGHGSSVKKEEDLGYFYTEDINNIIEDLHDVTKYIKKKYPNLPLYLFSHSMGTLVARGYIQKYDNEIDKLVLCGPPTKNSLTKLAILLSTISKPFKKATTPNYFLNKLTFGSYNKGNSIENSWLSKNKKNIEEYNQDPLCGFIFTTNGFNNLYKLMDNAFKKSKYQLQNQNLPILLIAGANDPVIQNEAKFNNLVSFLNLVGYTQTKSKLYPELGHEILNEEEKTAIYKDILNFLENKGD